MQEALLHCSDAHKLLLLKNAQIAVQRPGKAISFLICHCVGSTNSRAIEEFGESDSELVFAVGGCIGFSPDLAIRLDKADT